MLKIDGSSLIQSVNYVNHSEELTIRFHDGTLYRYFNVEPMCVCEFLYADSKGTFFLHDIKGVYDCEKVEQS